MTSPQERRAAASRKKAEFLAAQRRADRKRRLLLALIPVVVVVAVVVALILVNVTGKSAPTTTASDDVVTKVTSVPVSVLNQVGLGGVKTVPIAINGATLTQDGKPRILYIGAEFCPYCAAQRWPFAVALSRFGTFTNLSQTASSASDAYPNTATLSFHGATYTSQYLSLTAYETTTNQPQGNSYAPLDTVSDADKALTAKYDAPPYFDGGGSIPFILYAGQYASAGSLYTPGVLDGLSHAQIASALSDPGSAAGKAIDGAANLITAVLCRTTNGEPGAVCAAAGVKAAAANLSARSATS